MRALSKHLSNMDKLGVSTTSVGSSFQSLIILEVKKHFPMPNLSLPCFSFMLFPPYHRFPAAQPGTFLCFPCSGSCRRQQGSLSLVEMRRQLFQKKTVFYKIPAYVLDGVCHCVCLLHPPEQQYHKIKKD